MINGKEPVLNSKAYFQTWQTLERLQKIQHHVQKKNISNIF